MSNIASKLRVSSNLSGNSASEIAVSYEKKLLELQRKLVKQHQSEVKQIKFRSGLECIDFVTNAAKPIMKACTLEYRNLLTQFIDFRQKTWNIIDTLTDYSDRMVVAEQTIAQ